MTAKCQHCGGERPDHRPKFCTQVCAMNFHLEKKLERESRANQTRRQAKKIACRAAGCSHTFYPAERGKIPAFCSRLCARRHRTILAKQAETARQVEVVFADPPRQAERPEAPEDYSRGYQVILLLYRAKSSDAATIPPARRYLASSLCICAALDRSNG